MALAVHPVTLEVFKIPPTSLVSDAQHPVAIDHERFERLAATGALSAEKFVENNSQVFETSQIFVVRMRGGAVAWASRMSTCVLDKSVPYLLRGEMGREFVWLWPMNKAFHQYLTRKDRQQRDTTEIAAAIDEHEPSISYAPVNPGQMLGPDDVEGAEKINPSELTAKQRFFVSSINSQQTLFARRVKESSWTSKMTELVDGQQSKFGNRSAAPESLNVFLPEPALKRQLSSSVLDSDMWTKRKRVSVSESSHKWVDDLVCSCQERESRAIAELWGGLPEELLSKILVTRLCSDLDSSAAAAAAAITTMRSLSKAWCATIDDFVGAQLATLHASVEFCESVDPGTVGRRVRSMGLVPRDVFRLEGWRSYLRLRIKREKLSPSDVNRPRSSPSESVNRIAKRLTYHELDKAHDAFLRQPTAEEQVAKFAIP